ncbi:hypothetical protein J6590_074286 [Homalodisca vitripennis]|nr:hypothetical protein J6590_074286 [Homalodisca vitripennis]
MCTILRDVFRSSPSMTAPMAGDISKVFLVFKRSDIDGSGGAEVGAVPAKKLEREVRAKKLSLPFYLETNGFKLQSEPPAMVLQSAPCKDRINQRLLSTTRLLESVILR